MDNSRALYIHCGLHKTGTKTLQHVLSTQADSLRSAGFLFPLVGRLSSLGGQHNLAWRLARDRRFERRWGDLDALFNEIDNFGGKILISSEDFESSLRYPARWTPLIDRARTASRPTILILYLRQQASYSNPSIRKCSSTASAKNLPTMSTLSFPMACFE